MIRLIFFLAAFWILFFSFRVMQIGGIDPTFKEEGIQFFAPFRHKLSETIDEIIPFPQSALFSGIILGNQTELPYYLKKDLQVTSTIHMVVVSGQNLTILAGFVASLTGIFGRRKTIILTLFVILLYSLITGFGVPVVRAAVMVYLSYLGIFFGKESTGWWVLILTAGLMLLYQPNWILNISFQLSFLATFGVMVVAPVLSDILEKIPKILREDFAVTLSAQLMVLPVIAYNFNQISVAGLFANSLVLWTIPIIMITGFLAMTIGFFNILFGQIIGLVPGILLTYFLDIVQLFSKIPGAGLTVFETNVIFWLGYYLILGVGVWKLRYVKMRKNGNIRVC